MGLEDTIYEELMEAFRAGEPIGPIHEKYERNKTTYFSALSRATKDATAESQATVLEVKGTIDQLQREHEPIKKAVSDAEKTLEDLNNKITTCDDRITELGKKEGELDQRIGEKGETLRKAEDIEESGFTAERLVNLGEKIKKIGSKHGLSPDKAVVAFFEDLKSWDEKLGLEPELNRLSTEIKTKKSERDRWASDLDTLQAKHSTEKVVIDEWKVLKRRGVGSDHIFAWGRILEKLKLNPVEFEAELRDYSTLRQYAGELQERVDGLEKYERELQAKVQTLEGRRDEIEGAIRELKNTGVKKIEDLTERVEELTKEGIKNLEELAEEGIKNLEGMGQQAKTTAGAGLEELQKMVDLAKAQFSELRQGAESEIKRAGEAKAEVDEQIGRLRAIAETFGAELKNVRYFMKLPLSEEALDKLVEDLNPIVVQQYLNIAHAWCLKKCNPKLKPPEEIVPKKYYSIANYTNVELADAVRMALLMLVSGGAKHG